MESCFRIFEIYFIMPKLYSKVELFLLQKLIHGQHFHYQLTRNFNQCEVWGILFLFNQNSSIPKPRGIKNYLNRQRLQVDMFYLLMKSQRLWKIVDVNILPRYVLCLSVIFYANPGKVNIVKAHEKLVW